MSGIPSDEEEDDAWSYSFPPSTDSLAKDERVDTSNSRDAVNDQSTIKNTDSTPILSGKNTFGEQNGVVLNHDGEDADHLSLSSSSLSKGKDQKSQAPPNAYSASMTSSVSSMSIAGPSVGKSSPADPHMTKHDANSVMSKEIPANEHPVDGNGQTQQLVSSKASISSSLKQPSTPELTNAESNLTRNLRELESLSPTNEFSGVEDDMSATSASSPKIITYRKSKRTISNGNLQGALDKSSKPSKEKYDPKLYVDEFYKQTPYRYATMKRNTEFHQLFRSIDLTDRLLDDFSCALSREILLQGRIYISENHICFSSNLLGWVTNIVLLQEDVIKIEKKSTAGLFPNGIAIETKTTKHNFASFLSRDATYDFVKTVWLSSTGRSLDIKDENRNEEEEEDICRSSQIDSGSRSKYEEASEKFESYILSIDGDDDKNDSGTDEDETTSVGLRDPFYPVKETISENKEIVNVRKFKPELNYVNMGPDTHSLTKVPKDYVEENNETELCNETIEAPLGVVFDILFGTSNTSFHSTFLENHGGSELSDYGKFHPMESDPSKLSRTINYRRELGYSIGPKSTRCEVTEIIEKLNFDDHIVVSTLTNTPDVPLGNSFTVQTRYCFSWGPNNSTNLRISYIVNWSSTSWIRSVIEKLTLSGQKETTNDLLEDLQKCIEEETIIGEGEQLASRATTIEEISETENLGKEEIAQNEKVTPLNRSTKLSSAFNLLKNNSSFMISLGVILFCISFLIQLRIYIHIRSFNEMSRRQLAINYQLTRAVQGLYGTSVLKKDRQNTALKAKEAHNDLWGWVNERYGKRLTSTELTDFLISELNALQNDMYEDDLPKQRDSIEDKFHSLKSQAAEVYNEGFKIESIKDTLGNLL